MPVSEMFGTFALSVGAAVSSSFDSFRIIVVALITNFYNRLKT